MRKKQTKQYFFSFILSCRKIYVLLENIWKNLVYIVTVVLQSFHVVGYWKCSNKTTTPI